MPKYADEFSCVDCDQPCEFHADDGETSGMFGDSEPLPASWRCPNCGKHYKAVPLADGAD